MDGLARLCQQQLGSDPFSGTLFVFRNRRGAAIKILTFDGGGFWLCQRRLSSGRFRFWPESTMGAGSQLAAHQLQLLIMGGDPAAGKVPPAWRPLSVAA